MEQAPKVISGLMKDKEMLIGAGAYDESYFSELSSIQTSISNSLVSEKIQSAKSKEDLVK